MSHPTKPTSFQKLHGSLWYAFPSYRLAWVVLPQALVALILAVFVLGGGISTFGFGSGPGLPSLETIANDWGKPSTKDEVLDEMITLRDGVGNNSAPEGLDALEQMSKDGSLIASTMLGALYDPLLTEYLPYPVDKDVNRAISYYHSAADAGEREASKALAKLYMTPDTAVYDIERGCTQIIKFMDQPDDVISAMNEDYAWYIFSAADCLSGHMRPQGEAQAIVTSEAAQKAITLYNHPAVKAFPARYQGLGELYMIVGSPVFDMKKGCENARLWAPTVFPETSFMTGNDTLMMTETAYCLLGVDGRRDSVEYAPKPEDEKLAKAILEIPIMTTDIFGVTAAAWYNFNEDHAYHDVAKGCKFVNIWADLVAGGETSIERLNDWLRRSFASCLLSTTSAIPTFTPTPEQMKMGLALLQFGVDRKDQESQIALGDIYYWGSPGIEIDRVRAMEFYESCALDSNPRCIRMIGVSKQYGEGGYVQNVEEAILEYKTCAALGEPLCDAAVVWARIVQFPQSKGTDSDTLAHLKSATDKGNSWGYSLKGVVLNDGLFGLRPDYEQSAQWFIKAFSTSRGVEEVDRFESKFMSYITKKEFWRALHSELKARGVYNGSISSKLTADTLSSAKKLAGTL